MTSENLLFFDKFGKNLNLQFDEELGYFTGTIYFEPISVYLFENENIFILEKVESDYKFPTLEIGSSIEFSWSSSENKAEYFIYDVEKDLVLDQRFINKVEKKIVTYDDLDPTHSSQELDLRFPLQVNIAFSPSEEKKFERTLCIFHSSDYSSPGQKTKIAEISFYGEGEDEEERFKTWTTNFGIKFLREDANLLKDYDIKEALPDTVATNIARKELLVSKEHIYPYVGTYKGLANFVNILGYKDTLKVKEYWLNYNQKSPYFKKMSLVDISDYLDDGKIDSLDLVDSNRSLKESRQFKKTEFLALVYEFTRVTGDYDDDGIPIVEETTEFTVDEIFYKLNRLGEKLKNEFIPVNVKIKDIIGEFIYFQKITLSYWRDDSRIFDYDLNDPAEIDIYPGEGVNLVLRALDPLYKKLNSVNGIDFGVARINDNSAPNPFSVAQIYNRAENELLIENIHTFYDEIRDQRFPNIGQKLTWEYGDDPERVIGAPIVFTLDTGRFTIDDLAGVKLEDLDAIAPGLLPYWTIENIDYRNFYEVKWIITKDAPSPYFFEQRGRIVDLHQIGHVLPYAGKYRVAVELTDFYGNTNVFSRFVTVQEDMKPDILAFTRLEDKFDYTISNLSNVTIQDFGGSYLYAPRVTVLDNDNAYTLDIYRNLLEWISFFKNRYGMGQNIYDAEVYDPEISQYVPFEELDPSVFNKKTYWGLGEESQSMTIKDAENMTIGSLFWQRLSDYVYVDDFNAGFYFRNPRPGDKITISLFPEYTLPYFDSLQDLIDQLNVSTEPGIKLFNYEIIRGRRSDLQYIIHAQAKYLSKEMYHILSMPGGGSSPSPSPDSLTVTYSPSPSPSPSGSKGDKYTFFLTHNVFSEELVEFMSSISPVFDDETLFLLAKTSDILSGAVQDPSFWVENKYWKFIDGKQIGHLPTLIDQNPFNMADTKMFDGSFEVPENVTVWFVVNNLDGKNDFVWTLTNDNTGEEVFRVRSVPFFVWKFKDIGKFSIKVDVTDNRGTIYSNYMKKFVEVVTKAEYVPNVEARLNHRKALTVSR